MAATGKASGDTSLVQDSKPMKGSSELEYDLGTTPIALIPTKDQSVAGYGTVEELGYNTAYRRVFRSLGNLCMVTALTTPLAAILVTANYQIYYAGYWGLSWGWIIPSVLVAPEVLAIAELASSMPLNGSFYWWSGALAPPKYSKLISFVTGWLNVLAMFSATAAFVYAVASSITFFIAILAPEHVWTNAQLMGLAYGVLFVWASLMSLRLENISMMFMGMAGIVLLTTIVFAIGLPVSHAVQGRPFAAASDVFGAFLNSSDWVDGVAIPYSWFAALWVNSAWMCPVYVAEETHNARREIPKSILLTYTTTSVLGVLICILSAFCITDMGAAASDPSGYPLVTMIVGHWGQTCSGAFFIVSLPVGLFGGSGTLVTYASQIAAFARDHGIPYGDKFASVHPRVNLPTYSVALLVTGTGLILLFGLSPAASSIIYSLSVVAGLITFVVPVTLRIFAGDRWVPGPFSLGRWSIPCHSVAALVQCYLIIMECFPETSHVTGATMNWNSAVTAASIGIAFVLYWFIGDRYRGVDQEALALWRQTHHEDGDE